MTRALRLALSRNTAHTVLPPQLLPSLGLPIGVWRAVGGVYQPDPLATALGAPHLRSDVISHCWSIRPEPIAKLGEVECLVMVARGIVTVSRHHHLVIDQRLERPALGQPRNLSVCQTILPPTFIGL